jgi:hypothetical protein
LDIENGTADENQEAQSQVAQVVMATHISDQISELQDRVSSRLHGSGQSHRVIGSRRASENVA